MDLSLPRGVVRLLLRGTAGLPSRTHMSIAMERRWYAIASAAVRPPKGTAIEAESLGGVPVYRATCAGIAEGRAVLYLHGGGYGTFAKGAYCAFVRSISLRTSTAVHAPDYPLAPERPFPAALDAALAAWRALAGREEGPIVLAGDSAGGGLALATALALRDAGERPPAGLVLFSPWLDLTHSGASFERNGPAEPILTHRDSLEKATAYAAGADLRDSRISPLFAESLAGLPPVHLLGAADDLLVSDADRLAERIRSEGGAIEYERHDGLWHDFQLFGEVLAEARDATAAACAAIEGFFAASVAPRGAVEAAAEV